MLWLSLSLYKLSLYLNIHNIHLSWRSRGWQTWRSWLLMSECGSDCGSLSNITHQWIESAQLPRHPAQVLPTAPHGSTAPHTPDGESGRYGSRHWSDNFSNLSLTELLKHRDLRGIPLKDCQTSSTRSSYVNTSLSQPEDFSDQDIIIIIKADVDYFIEII